MTYSTLDWACDQIRAYEASHGRRPEYFLVTPRQALGLIDTISAETRIQRSPPAFLRSVRKGEAYLCGVPLKLFEVEHAPGQ
jgi:hypothetical protein